MLVIALPLLHLNQIIAAAKRHWSVYASLKRVHTNRVAWEARAQRVPRITRPVRFHFIWWPRDERVDPDGEAAGSTKVLLDGLVVARVLPDDSPAWVRGLYHDFMSPDPVHPRVVVSWEEVDG